jgi:hypothetical protein
LENGIGCAELTCDSLGIDTGLNATDNLVDFGLWPSLYLEHDRQRQQDATLEALPTAVYNCPQVFAGKHNRYALFDTENMSAEHRCTTQTIQLTFK